MEILQSSNPIILRLFRLKNQAGDRTNLLSVCINKQTNSNCAYARAGELFPPHDCSPHAQLLWKRLSVYFLHQCSHQPLYRTEGANTRLYLSCLKRLTKFTIDSYKILLHLCVLQVYHFVILLASSIPVNKWHGAHPLLPLKTTMR